MRKTPLEAKIEKIVQPVVEDLGFSLYCVKATGDGGAQVLQVMAEDPATKRLGVDDCASISRAISAVLDVEDPIDGKYRLEVSSPGIDRYLMRLEDFEAYKGFDVKLETDIPAENGQRKFRGRIDGIKNETITLLTDQGEAIIGFNTIAKAKLVMSDALIKATA